jgi:hypothetical protein
VGSVAHTSSLLGRQPPRERIYASFSLPAQATREGARNFTHGRLPRLPTPQTIPFPSRLTSLYCIHRIVASPATVPPRTHSFNRCIHLCRYPARPSSYISAHCTSQQACNPTLPKLINQLDAALFVHGQGCLQRTYMENNSIIHPFTFSTPALFYTITSRPSTLSKQH